MEKISITIFEEQKEFIQEMMELTGWSQSRIVRSMMAQGTVKFQEMVEFMRKHQEELWLK